MRRIVFIVCLCSLAYCNSVAQIQPLQSPHFSGFEPVNGGSNSYPQAYQQTYPQQPQVRMGGNAQDIINQQQNRMVNQTVAQKQADLQAMLRDIQEMKGMYAPANNLPAYNPAENAKAVKEFFPALHHLEDMLTGKSKLSVADAYYTIESAYGNPYISRQQYNDVIRQSVDFIRLWMQQQGLDLEDNYMVHYAIQKFMSEPLTVTKTKNAKDNKKEIQTTTHQPFYYDYEDYEYIKDYRNAFLTKCLATGFGQCNSMPAVYLVLAEAMGVKAYLTFAPNHSFIKFPDNSGYIYNFEPTSHWQISDKWYKDNMFISEQAVRTGIYLDTLNYRQIVANCIFDLATEYMRVDHSLNDDFIIACLKSGTPYFPKNNNLPSLFIYSLHLKTMLREVMRKNHITDINQVGSSPEAKALYKEYMGNEAYITKLGYQDMPAGMYEELLKEHEFKGKVQEGYKINGKEKRNLFTMQ